MRRAHYRTEQIGMRLVDHLAPAVAAALADLQRQQSECDGWPSRGGDPGRGSADTSTTESAALMADSYGGRSQEINDVIDGIEISVGHLAKLVIGIDHTPAALMVKRCSDGQRVYGRTLEWSDDDQCQELPVKQGMCLRHYMRCYRFRVDHHLPVDHYFEVGL